MKKKKPGASRPMPYFSLPLIYLSTFLLSGVFSLQAQDALARNGRTRNNFQQNETRITLDIKNERLQQVLERIEKQTPYVFVYANDEIKSGQKVTISVKDKGLNQVLDDLLTPLKITYQLLNAVLQ